MIYKQVMLCGQELLQCSILLEKLQNLSQSHLRQILLVRHEEASAKVQRELIEWRRVELHKIFSEELEEATRMGELDGSSAKRLQHKYFACQVSILLDAGSFKVRLFKFKNPAVLVFIIF